MQKRFSSGAVLGLCLSAFVVSSAGATGGVTRVVDDDGQATAANCNATNSAFSTIQSAVNASNPGDTILVCPGVYPEQVTIAKSLTVRGVASGNENLVLIRPGVLTVPNTTSFATGNPIAAIVLVKEAKGVTLTNLTVDGADNVLGGCGPNLVGIFYRNASGKVEADAVRNIRLGPASANLGGCQSGIGIFAQSGTGPGSPSKLTVIGSTVHDYQKTGIVGNEAGTELTAIGNGVAGDGPTPLIAQNGIQIGFGATGTISFNSVVNQVWSLCVDLNNCSFSSTAVLIFDADSVNVTANSIAKSQTGIYLYLSDNSAVTLNVVSDTDVWDGIAVVGNNNRVNSNLIFNSDESGVYVDGNNNKVQNNTINDTPCGIFAFSGTGNNLSGNFFFNTQQKTCAAAVTPLSLLSLSSTAATDSQRSQPVR